MLHSTYRFHGYNALRYTYKSSKSFRGEYFSLKYQQNKRRKNPRIAIVVSKKVLKGAVGRNRIRRRLYEQFRMELPALAHNLDIICIVHSAELREMPSEELARHVKYSLTQTGLYKSHEKNGTIQV